MNRFGKGRLNLSKSNIFTAASILFFVLLLSCFLIGIQSISKSSVEKQKQSLETALQRDIVHCYAVEGTYPPSLEYIKSHYGLTYNEDLFFVDYQPIGANLMPDVTIIERKTKE